jgi:hypothetical protein
MAATATVTGAAASGASATGAARAHRVWWGWDLAFVALFFLAGALLGRSALQAEARAGRAPAFYQNWLAGAVFDACGFGYTEVALDRLTPPLADFLALKSDSVSCRDLPTAAPLQPANWYAQMHRYLGASLTLLWKIRGIRWSALGPLFEGFCGLAAALVYALFRLGMNRWWSIAGAAAIAASGLNLFYLHKLRDYSKAPFLLASLLILGWLAAAPASPRRLLALSCLFGGVIGVGLGFRTDIIVAVPLFLLVLGLFLPAPRPTWALRGCALLVFVCTVAVSGWPVLRAYGHGNNSAHVTLLGFTEQFSDTLGLERTDYTLNQIYGDRPIESAVRNYALLTMGGSGWSVLTSVTYDRFASRFLWAVARTLPADVLVHAYAAMLRVFESPFDGPGQQDCESLRPSLAGTACHARNIVLRPLRPFGPLAAAVLLVLVIAADPRRGAFLAAVVAVFAGSTMLQFDPRHTFYLEFMSLWALAFLAQRAGALPRVFREWRRRGWRDQPPRTSLLWGTGAVIILFIIPAALLMATRAYQQRTLTALFTRYLAAEVDPLPIASWADAPPWRRLLLDDLLPPLDPRALNVPTLRSAFLRMEFGGQACAGRSSYVIVRYEVPFNGALASQGAVLQWSVPATPTAGATDRLFVPVYRMLVAVPGGDLPVGELRLLGLEMLPADVPCLVSLAAMRRPSDFPIRLMASLGPDWQERRHYQTLSTTGARNTPGLP